ncbi:hypothetical protein OH76DRAFT_489829 [Lentinus brumalis]|uniref:Uncharacterized protein n=1 Tax=Lentinus brumalis TaxID=2498619 RepID=A0A371CI32_9APHY|nr:hypothetical protein OH76DRAFT_489829 [Polyporus brumalis]
MSSPDVPDQHNRPGPGEGRDALVRAPPGLLPHGEHQSARVRTSDSSLLTRGRVCHLADWRVTDRRRARASNRPGEPLRSAAGLVEQTGGRQRRGRGDEQPGRTRAHTGLEARAAGRIRDGETAASGWQVAGGRGMREPGARTPVLGCLQARHKHDTQPVPRRLAQPRRPATTRLQWDARPSAPSDARDRTHAARRFNTIRSGSPAAGDVTGVSPCSASRSSWNDRVLSARSRCATARSPGCLYRARLEARGLALLGAHESRGTQAVGSTFEQRDRRGVR